VKKEIEGERPGIVLHINRILGANMALKKRFPVLGVCLFLGWSLLSCGLDDIPYISPVSELGWSHTVSGTAGGINLSLAEGSSNFQRFVIFYRIYLSTALGGLPDLIGWDDSNARTEINPTLASDFNHFLRLADHVDATVSTAGLYMNFVNRGFLKLELEGADIDNVLGRGSLGGTLAIDFLQEPGRRPRLTLNGRHYYLRRAQHSFRFHDFSPVPVVGGFLPFFNHPELLSSANRTEDINADVAPQIPTNSEHSYVLMYIFAEGLGYGTPPPTVFSQATYLGVFRLPNH